MSVKSTDPESDDSDLQTSLSSPLHYAVTHVFLPVKLPDTNDYTPENDFLLARAVCSVARAYSSLVSASEQSHWHRISKMLGNFQTFVTPSGSLDKAHVISQLREMQVGDILAFFVPPQNAAVILTKREKSTLCESFEVSPSTDAIEEAAGSLICSYPQSAVETSNEVFEDGNFQTKLANFLSGSDVIGSDHSVLVSPGVTVLLARVFRGVSLTADVPRITKRVRDHDGLPSFSFGMYNCGHIEDGWCRSSLWLLIKVAIQISLDRSALGRASYKRFMLFFVCFLAREANSACFSRDLLHSIACKILRRSSKLGSSSPDWLSEVALKTCTHIGKTLDTMFSQPSNLPSPFQSPSQDELTRDTQLSLFQSREYIRDALANPGHKPLATPFHPGDRPRGTIEDFLSLDESFFESACTFDSKRTLCDIERSVEEGIDDWFAGVTNAEEACAQLEALMDRYLSKALSKMVSQETSPEAISIAFLTAIELFVALDKLVVQQIPILADYSPGIPAESLEGLLLRKKTSLHRLSRAYQYLSLRQSRSRPGWSVFSDDFTEDSLPVRYYDQSPHHQRLKARIEEETVHKVIEHVGLQQKGGASRPLLPLSSLYAKVVVFELQCPAYLSIWRSAVLRILADSFLADFGFAGSRWQNYEEQKYRLLGQVPELQPYFVEREAPGLSWKIQFAYYHPLGSRGPELHYMLHHQSRLTLWRRTAWISLVESMYDGSPLGTNFIMYTSHTSNDVLAAQADCPADLSLDEFIAFGHLRSGGSLQWLNILQGLRNRSLNLRRREVHYLLAQAAFQVGPLDLTTGTWIWHQELHDPLFCHALLDELDSLFADFGDGSIDGVVMNSISLLLTRVLGAAPSEDVSARAIASLRSVRRKTFKWVQELSYNLTMAPMNEERSALLLDMAATCRSTFDVDATTLCKLCYSAEDVDALLSCALFVHTLRHESISDYYLKLLLNRDLHLSLIVEGILRDAILADSSDYGVDLAVSKIFATYQPGTHRWEVLQSPNARWLTCKTGATADQPSKTIHVDVLDGELRVDGQPIGGLPHTIRDCFDFREIFRDQGFFVIPSNLLGMDFTTLTMTSERKIHFSFRDEELVVRAQCSQTGDILELIPSARIREDLPAELARDHLYWLNLSTKTIEICPFRKESSENWRIDCGSEEYRAYKGRETLVDIQSQTWAVVSKYFERFNLSPMSSYPQRSNLLIAVSPVSSPGCIPARRLSVALPNYGLSFSVNEKEELESYDFKDMVYDENQCIGTLFGLENILVLRPKSHHAGAIVPEALIPRRVLIPNGLYREDNMPSNYISFIGVDESIYHTYDVDTERGCLVGNGDMASTEYLAYLHAMTSWHKPDPLTGKTGAQAALCLLRSAGCRSIMKLKDRGLRDFWRSSPYPQLNAAYKEIQERYYWNVEGYDDGVVAEDAERRAARRGAYLFSWHATKSTPTEDSGNDNEGDLVPANVPPKPALFALPCVVPLPQDRCNERISWPLTIDQLLSNRPAPELPSRSTLRRDSHTKLIHDNPELHPLFSTFPRMKKSDAPFKQEYIGLLENSAQRARKDSRMIHSLKRSDQIGALREHYAECKMNYLGAMDALKKSLGPTTDPLEQALEQFGQWPPITADYLLRYLASTSPIKLPPHWKKCLIFLALLLLDLQRARRLLRYALDGLEEEFSKELESEVCDGWNVDDYPDWLLIQIQGNFLIRRTQAETAMQMISPQSGGNTVMQVNMGEGKSSVIIPIAAAVLADGKQLVRVVVPKVLTIQVFEVLIARLGELANRPIYHLPFSRSPEYDYLGRVTSPHIHNLHKLMSQCMTERGVLLLQPEHVVSLKVKSVQEQIHKDNLEFGSSLQYQKSVYRHFKAAMSLTSVPKDSLVGNIYQWLRRSQNERGVTPVDHGNRTKHIRDVDDTSDGGSKWVGLQNWINSNARDILDESDEILHARFQLIYTIGLQQHMDGYPERWTVTQQVLQLLKEHIHTLSKIHPDSIEFEYGTPGSFPYIRIARAPEVGRHLTSMIVEDIMAGQLPNFNFQYLSPELQDAIRSFISDEDVLQIRDTAKRVEEYAKAPYQNHLWGGLLLLRGLLACNILLFALAERRWRVDYGLDLQSRRRMSPWDPIRTMLAVPYRAKDVPAPDTQFGHPDITIILTCLSYYYAGLTEGQLRVAFEILPHQDDPSAEYALWIKEYDDESLPDSLRKFREINLKSSEEWDKVIVSLFSRNQAVINFYLSRVLFPKEAQEFPWKLPASSWDLAEKREKLITGFSGTNDSRWLLPMSIAQRDLDQQKGTNARVLSYLLQSENDFYMITHKSGERRSTVEFLRTVAMQQPEIRVLLDVGAQILDFSNRQVAEAWLDIVYDAAGAVYFNEMDEVMVLKRNGTSQPLSSSPFSQRLGRCVVYLDHAHTRGIDLKLPIGSRAAIMLGPKLTKDSLVQGCMRMRKLGHGHSVMFFAPLEVDRSIRSVIAKKDPNANITTADILCWTIHETWNDIQRRAPYWAQQGMNHKSRHEAWSRFCNGEIAPEKLADAWLQPETKPLTNLYAPRETKNTSSSFATLDPEILQRCKTLGVLSLPSAQIEEEHEREVNREREREREVELAGEAERAEHVLHPDIVKFVKTGDIPLLHSGSAFRPIFTSLERSTAAIVTREANVWSPYILATADFCKTIKPESTRGTIDQYLRPVQWILTRNQKDRRDKVLVVLSPYEVNCLMPDIRESEYVHLHLYAPRTSRRMKPSDDLRLYVVPPLPPDWSPPGALVDQLNVFAGQLYLRDYASYLRLSRFLGVRSTESFETALRRNLFNIPGSFEENEIRFAGSPLPFVMALLAMRTRGRPFAETHMGKILQGQPLTKKDFEVPRSSEA